MKTLARRGAAGRRIVVAVAALAALAAAAGCSSGHDGPRGPEKRSLEDGGTLGKIERLPGGTAVPTDVRTLLTAECTDGTLRLRTNSEEVSARMDCAQMLPISVTERFIGKTVAISYRDGRLIVENEAAGTLEFPAKDPRVVEADATP